MNLICHRDLLQKICTEGMLYVPGRTDPFYTMELPWNDNEPDNSCVPYASFGLIPYFSMKHSRWTWCLHNPTVGVWAFPLDSAPAGLEQYGKPPAVVGRTCCEIHPANQAWQLEGCIAPGMTRGPMDIGRGMLPSVGFSWAAFDQLCQILAPTGEIRDAVGHTIKFVSTLPAAA